MSDVEAGVFGDSSDEEEAKNAKTRGKRAMQTLRELQKNPKSPVKDDMSTGDTDGAGVLGDDDEAEMARLRSTPKYLEFEKEYERHEEEGNVLKKQKTEDEDAELPTTTTAKVTTDDTNEITVSDSVDKKRRTVISSPRASSRKKLDPKIIDDSSDSDSSDDSDSEDLGPRLHPTSLSYTDHLPLQHGTTFGTPHGGHVSSITIDAAGSRMVSSAADGSIQFWDFNTMDSRLNCFKSTEPLNGGSVRGASFSSTGGKLLCWGALPNGRDGDGRHEYC